jgi:2-pyrone-4,6-dicarboxylate lactonase
MSMQHKVEPAFTAPPLSCDSHFHVLGPAERYPYGGDLRYAPPLAPLSEYLALARRMGIERYVFVQPSAYARDNSCLIDAMNEVTARYGPVCRGVCDVDEDVADAEIERLHAIGVRGVRVNVSPVKPEETGFARTLLPRIERLDARLSGIGWSLDFLLPGWLTTELMGTMEKLKANFTIAHMGMFMAKGGPDQPGFRQLIELLRGGRCWIKFTGVYRISRTPGFADAFPMARALIETAPDRIIWGSDYPHLTPLAGTIDSVELFNVLGQWAPDDSTRQKILVDNPRNLYGF